MTQQTAQQTMTISHVTVPCRDLVLAEQFYVELLGFTVVSRIDATVRARMGWSATDIEARAADHIGLTAGANGPRLDLFEYPRGIPAPDATKHPHIGIEVEPAAFDGWQHRLRAHGVPVDGPRRLGPPGQASVYFDDPFGNHLEIHAAGVPTDGLPFGGPQRSLRYDWAGLPAAG